MTGFPPAAALAAALALGGCADMMMMKDEPAGDGMAMAHAGQSYDATGEIACTMAPGAATEACPFGIHRTAKGAGHVTVTKPDGAMLVITFEDWNPVSYEGGGDKHHAKLVSSREDRDSIVWIGTERYVVPDEVLTGG